MAIKNKPETTTEEEIVDEESTETPEEEVEETDNEGAEDEEESNNLESEIDYKAIAEAEREKRAKAEKALAEQRYKKSEARRKEQEEDEGDDEDEDKPITRRDLRQIISETTQATEKKLLGTRIRELALSLADSEDEAEAIIATHANRPFPSGMSLEEQIEETHAIVNRKKLISKNKELTRALRGKSNASKDVGSPHRDPQPGSKPKIASDVEATLKRTGFIFSNKTRVWSKKLPNGKFLYKDPRAKDPKTGAIKTWMA